MPQILYWDGVIVPKAIQEQCKQELQQLLEGDYRSLNLEKLHVGKGQKIYSIRVNREDRVVFTEQNGKALILEYVKGHRYDNCIFLEDEGALFRYLQKNAISIEDAKSGKFQGDDGDELILLKSAPEDKGAAIQWVPIQSHGRKWVEFSPSQGRALTGRLPMVIWGGPGTGKTSIALSLLRQYADRAGEGTPPAIYVSQSAALVEEMRTRFFDMQLDNAAGVLFMTYDEWLRWSLGPDINIVGKDDFEEWFVNYRIKNPLPAEMTPCPPKGKGKKRPDLAAKALTENKFIWEELRACSGCGSLDEYRKLGPRESAVEVEQRAYIRSVLDAYLERLEREGKVSSALFTLPAVPRVGLSVLDEAQNWTGAQVVSAMGAAEETQVVTLIGEQQTLTQKYAPTECMKRKCKQGGIDLEEHHLSVSYRCAAVIVTFLQELKDISDKVAKGRENKDEERMTAAEGAAVGEVRVCSPRDLDLVALRIAANRTDFAVVTRPEYVDEVRQLLGEAVTVFTNPEGVQGLEYKRLFAHRVFDTPAGEDASLEFARVADTKVPEHRAKADEGNEKHRRTFYEWITFLSRAESTLTIVENLHNAPELVHHLARFAAALSKKDVTSSARAVAALAPAAEKHEILEASSDEDWVAHAHRLFLLGHIEQARKIWRLRLSMTSEQIVQIEKDLCLPKTTVHPRSPEPRSPAVPTHAASAAGAAAVAADFSPATTGASAAAASTPAVAVTLAKSRREQKKLRLANSVAILVGNFTKKNLEICWKGDRKIFLSLLLGVPAHGNLCVLEHVLEQAVNSAEKLLILLQFFSTYPEAIGPLLAYIDPEKGAIGLAVFLTDLALRELLIDNWESVKPHITDETLFLKTYSKNAGILARIYGETTPFYALCLDEQKDETAHALLDSLVDLHNEGKFPSLVDVLCSQIESGALFFGNYRAIMYFTSPHRLDILNKLLNPDLAAKLSGEDVLRIIVKVEAQHANSDPAICAHAHAAERTLNCWFGLKELRRRSEDLPRPIVLERLCHAGLSVEIFDAIFEHPRYLDIFFEIPLRLATRDRTSDVQYSCLYCRIYSNTDDYFAFSMSLRAHKEQSDKLMRYKSPSGIAVGLCFMTCIVHDRQDVLTSAAEDDSFLGGGALYSRLDLIDGVINPFQNFSRARDGSSLMRLAELFEKNPESLCFGISVEALTMLYGDGSTVLSALESAPGGRRILRVIYGYCQTVVGEITTACLVGDEFRIRLVRDLLQIPVGGEAVAAAPGAFGIFATETSNGGAGAGAGAAASQLPEGLGSRASFFQRTGQ